MIVKRRKPASSIPGRIVRRTRPAVGGQPRRIVRRGSGVTPPRGPRMQPPRFDWRPGRGLALGTIAVLFVGMLGFAGYAAYESRYFEVQHIEVVGNDRVDAAIVADRAGLDGQKMFTVDLERAQENLYSIPLVSKVHLDRSWPNTIVVRIEEREAWGTWEQGGVGYTIDREGVVIGTTPPPPGSPVIVSQEPGTRQLGDRVDYQAVDAAAQIYENLPGQLGTNVTEVAFLAGKGVQVTTSDGQVGMFGDSSGIDYKLAVWAAVAARADNEGIAYSIVDLRYGNRPVLQ